MILLKLNSKSIDSISKGTVILVNKCIWYGI